MLASEGGPVKRFCCPDRTKSLAHIVCNNMRIRMTFLLHLEARRFESLASEEVECDEELGESGHRAVVL